ncbi:protein mono-ADP-ribosyltransferase PARP9 isoform X2 [Scophthalmus maximus]|uniref:protein mono-ADP-ribosyltransferase PARP9 isoform X2 n=1 Tax=Scophthalmus maximus TaxID=52904 RepID=UPI001FA884EF|nr:protein mono-ADP-ribosyltransferase PARP9 isoform X2 [Scophthalmus maximus]
MCTEALLKLLRCQRRCAVQPSCAVTFERSVQLHLGTMASKLDIPLHGASVNIVRQCGSALSDVLQSKFGCVAIIEGVDLARDPTTAQQKKPTVTQEKRFTAALPSGVKVTVWKDDLTNVRADAVVNAANFKLQHWGGLALALSQAGGPQIQKECDDLITLNGDLRTGDAVVSAAGFLPCKMIIHAVGPHLSKFALKSDVSQAEPLLQKAIVSILDRVKEKRLKTVAIPAISSGLFNFPLPLCADTIVSTVKHYYENSSQGHLPEEILLVNNDEPSVREMERACRSILTSQPPTKTYSMAAAAAKNPATTVQIGNVLLTLKSGKIEEQQTDVIVNTASPDRDLSIGLISKALLKKAGVGLQNELNIALHQKYVTITKGYSLQCKEVYHTFCTEARENLFHSVLECLWLVGSSHHTSIAFPAIGTGGLRFSKKEVAQIMSDAVADFAMKFPKMLDIHFVIFPSDKDTFKAFEEAIRSLQQKASHLSFTQAFEHRDYFRDSKPPAPQISLSGCSEESTREAERWLCGILQSSGSITVRNNFIQHFGEQELRQLSRLTKKGVLVEECFEKGHADITVRGGSFEDVAVAGLQVEAMLCNIQREFVGEEERAMLPPSTQNVTFVRKSVDVSSDIFSDRSSVFRKEMLHILKLEKVENRTLRLMFEEKKKQLQCCTQKKMFQRIPAQFCEMVSHIGFHTEYAPPADPAYGEGIYFAGTVRKAMEVWKEKSEEYLYFVEAQVLTGNSTLGIPGLILPPALETNPQMMYDSVSGGPDISVIFSGYQALPMYIITCRLV